MDTFKSEFIKCQCHGEGMGVDYEPEDKLYYFSYWQAGLCNGPLSWKQRLRYCWQVLTKGRAFNDELILNQRSAERLVDFVMENKPISEERIEQISKIINEQISPTLRPKLKGIASVKLLDVALRSGFPVGEVDFGTSME